jgi:anti-sigma B factor antagonist
MTVQLKESKTGDALILHLEGELMGGDETRAFQERIYSAIREGAVQIVVDMEQVKWMNSSGLGSLMAGMITLRGSGGDMRLAKLNDRVRRPIEITKLDQILKIYDSVEEAAAGFGKGA